MPDPCITWEQLLRSHTCTHVCKCIVCVHVQDTGLHACTYNNTCTQVIPAQSPLSSHLPGPQDPPHHSTSHSMASSKVSRPLLPALKAVCGGTMSPLSNPISHRLCPVNLYLRTNITSNNHTPMERASVSRVSFPSLGVTKHTLATYLTGCWELKHWIQVSTSPSPWTAVGLLQVRISQPCPPSLHECSTH